MTIKTSISFQPVINLQAIAPILTRRNCCPFWTFFFLSLSPRLPFFDSLSFSLSSDFYLREMAWLKKPSAFLNHKVFRFFPILTHHCNPEGVQGAVSIFVLVDAFARYSLTYTCDMVSVLKVWKTSYPSTVNLLFSSKTSVNRVYSRGGVDRCRIVTHIEKQVSTGIL